jgi:hypothetical protein
MLLIDLTKRFEKIRFLPPVVHGITLRLPPLYAWLKDMKETPEEENNGYVVFI